MIESVKSSDEVSNKNAALALRCNRLTDHLLDAIGSSGYIEA